MPAKMERTSTPGIFKRGSRYVVVWRDAYGKQRKDSFRTMAEAREYQGKRRQGDERHAYSHARFTDYSHDWLRTYTGRTAYGLSDSTRKDYKRSIERWAIPFFARKKIGTIGPRDVRAFVKHMEQEGARLPTIRKTLAPLKALFATAYEDGDIQANPTVGLRLRIADDRRRKIRALTREELRLIIGAVPEAHRPLLTFLAQTGLRISEATGVTWADLDLGTKPHVKVRRQCYKGHVKALKTQKSRRDVPLTQGMTAALLRLRARSYHGEHAPVFCSRVGTHLSSHNLRSRVLKPATRPLGLEWVGFHTFRHTCASMLFAPAQDGGGAKNVKQVQEWLGHADPEFTLRTYVHLTDGGVGPIDFLDDALDF